MNVPSMETDATNKFYLRLPEPHDHVVITCPRLEDADDIIPIMNDQRVYPWMGAGLPFPHKHEHALGWLKSVKARCDLAQDDLRAACSEKTRPQVIRECPVRIIREVKVGREIYLGDCGIGRWGFSDVGDEQNRERFKRENEEKIPGDPTIVWTIGDYLAPSHHGQGIMGSAIRVLMDWAAANMNVRHIRTTAMEGNGPSVKVLEKNGFKVEKTLPEFASKRGTKVGLHIMDWKAPS